MGTFSGMWVAIALSISSGVGSLSGWLMERCYSSLGLFWSMVGPETIQRSLRSWRAVKMRVSMPPARLLRSYCQKILVIVGAISMRWLGV